MKKIVQKQLGEILIEARLISREQLDDALKHQRDKGGMIGEILVILGHTSEESIAQALTAQYGFPYLPLGGYSIDSEVARIIPLDVSKKYGLVAVDRVGGVLTVAMSNPLNQTAIQDVENLTHLKTQVFVSTNMDIRNAIMRCYGA